MLISWLSARQYAPEGGFSGRTNKLVDGCYSWWVGGCWPLIEAALNGVRSAAPGLESERQPVAGSLHNREGLIRYILSCCQEPTGGLRDKPSRSVWPSAQYSRLNMADIPTHIILATSWQASARHRTRTITLTLITSILGMRSTRPRIARDHHRQTTHPKNRQEAMVDRKMGYRLKVKETTPLHRRILPISPLHFVGRGSKVHGMKVLWSHQRRVYSMKQIELRCCIQSSSFHGVKRKRHACGLKTKLPSRLITSNQAP